MRLKPRLRKSLKRERVIALYRPQKTVNTGQTYGRLETNSRQLRSQSFFLFSLFYTIKVHSELTRRENYNWENNEHSKQKIKKKKEREREREWLTLTIKKKNFQLKQHRWCRECSRRNWGPLKLTRGKIKMIPKKSGAFPKYKISNCCLTTATAQACASLAFSTLAVVLLLLTTEVVLRPPFFQFSHCTLQRYKRNHKNMNITNSEAQG